MALQADAQGFLVGTPVDIGRAMGLWRGIREDVSAIRKALAGSRQDSRTSTDRLVGAIKASTGVQARVASVAVTTPRRSGGSGGAKEAAAVRAVVTASRSQAQQEGASAAGGRVRTSKAAQQAAIATRDARGRFVKGGGNSPDGGGGGGGGGGGREAGERASVAAGIKGVADRLVGAVNEAAGDLEEADPTLKAYNEVVQPLKRGMGALFGGGQDRWFKRIWQALTGFRKDSDKANKKEQKTLEHIEDKTGAKEGGGSGILATLAAVFAGLLAKLGLGGGGGIGGVALRGLGGLLGRAGKGMGGIFGKLGKFGRRIPVLGPLLSLFGAGTDAIAAEDNPELTRRQKDRQVGGAVGGGVGAVLGGVVGTIFGGPLGGIGGAMLGDQIGQIVGEQVGVWVNDLRAADIPGMISSTWNDFSATLSGYTKDATTMLSNAATEVNKTLEEWTGIDFGGLIQEAIDKLGSVTDMLGEWLSEKLGTTWAGVKSKASGVMNAVGSAYNTVKAYATGDVLKNKEAMVDQMDRMGMTDPNERAMFMAQADHESGGFVRMDESMKYTPQRLREISSRAKGMSDEQLQAVVDGGDKSVGDFLYDGKNGNGKGEGYMYRGRGQFQLTGRANYAAAGKALGLDLLGNPDLAADPEVGAKIAGWYWNSRVNSADAQAGDVYGVRRAINGGINGLGAVTGLFKDYQSNPIPYSPVPVAAKSVAPTPASIPDAPQIQVPLAEGGKRQPVPVVVAPQDAPQDMRDRGIALIATGGLSKT